MKKVMFWVAISSMFFKLYSQSSFLDAGTNGVGVLTSVRISDSEISQFGGMASYSIGGFIDLGAMTNVASSEYEDNDIKEFNFSFFYNVLLIKQKYSMPFSVQFLGSYGMTNFAGDYLDENDITKDGRGYSFGVNIFRDNYLNPNFALRLGTGLDFNVYKYTTNIAAVETEEKDSEFSSNFHGGVIMKSSSGFIFAFILYTFFDENDEISFGPSIQIVSPFN